MANLPSWLYKRPRILNVLHMLGLANGHTQMVDIEQICLSKHAFNKKNTLEIGTYMGVSANLIVKAMNKEGHLYCVDPYEKRLGKENPCLSIAKRDLKRNFNERKVTFLQGYSNDKNIIAKIPAALDFIFVDGDHSYEGLTNDWAIVRDKLGKGGIVALHDTIVPENQAHRNFGSVKFFNETIKADSEFELIDSSYSMTVLKRK